MSGTPLALFVGIEGLELAADEAAFLREANPYGLFLFRRNLDNPDQVRRLCAAVREAVGRADAPIFIDQEGGRVQRLDNGNWPSFRSLGAFGALARKDLELAKRAMRLSTQAMGAIMTDLTIDSGTTPVVDLARKGTHDVIGQRAFGDDPELVVTMAREVIEGMLEVGALPIMKHIPGYGRVTVDPHFDCPIVDARLDDLRDDRLPALHRPAGHPVGDGRPSDLHRDRPGTSGLGFAACLRSHPRGHRLRRRADHRLPQHGGDQGHARRSGSPRPSTAGNDIALLSQGGLPASEGGRQGRSSAQCGSARTNCPRRTQTR